VNGKDIQPTPRVVEERLKHHQQMLEAQHDEVAGATAKPPSAGADAPARAPDVPSGSHQGNDRRDTEQLCHDLLHGGKRPADAASNPQRCE
jgi:hypothetical protein